MARVHVLAPDGTPGTVDEKDLASLPDGARILTNEEVAQAKLEAEYAKASTGAKVAGVLGVGPKNPQLDAFAKSAQSALTAGASEAATRIAADAIMPGAGKQYAEHVDDLATAYPGTTTAGTVAGIAGGAAIGMAGGAGAGAGLTRALPMNAAAAAGAPIEHGITRALAPLAARGALGRAATQGAAIAVRGAVEGGAYSAAEQIASDRLHDTPTTGAKLYAATGHGALLGGTLGGALGFGGSLVGSAGRGIAGRASARASRVAELGEAMPRGVEVPFIDANAGLGEAAPAGEDVFTLGREHRPMQLRPGGRPGRAITESPIDIAGGVSIDADAGIAARDSRGAFQGKFKTEEAFRPSSAKTVPRDVMFGEGGFGDLAPIETKAPIRIPEGAPAPKAGGLMEALSDPSSAARGLAQDQAWKAFGAGFGLQTTRYAKEATKYFPDGTRGVAEIGIRHGILDMGEAGSSPLASAWQAAKTGTPADIAVRAAAATEEVGQKIGAITEQSGARIPLPKAMGAVDEVVNQYRREAGRGPLASAAETYREELRGVLRTGRDGSVSVQDLLTQRKILDDIVYEEAKTLDPRGRVKALREVRTKLEGVITDALDEASGQVPGAQRAEYQRLKKDYHGLRIISEAAEDSAARSAKAATFGLGEKFAIASSVAGGHFTAAPILAMGGKMIRERGNAAAAAFLSRAAEQGTFETLVKRFDMRVSRAAEGVLREGPQPGQRPKLEAKPTPRDAVASREAAKREGAAKQAQAQTIVKWMGEHQANPERILQQVEEAAAIVARSAGPKASESYTAATMRAIRFIAAHIPIKERRDPLDPRSTPPLTHEEADRLLRATKYGLHPETILADFERGIITPEGLRGAKTLLPPESFEDFQLQLQEHVENHMLHNRRLTQSQRLKIDKLLGYPAGADLRPKAIARLQANLMKAPEEPPQAAPTGPGGSAPPPPLDMKIQQSGFDAIEARKAG